MTEPDAGGGRVSTRVWLTLGGFYFLYYGAFVFYMPFVNLYLQQAGLSGAQIGIIKSLSPWVPIFSAPLWGLLGDWLQLRRRLLMVSLIGALPSALLVLQMDSVAGLTLLTAASALFFSSIIPLITSISLEALGDRHAQYGRLRLWGAVGWGVLGPVAGALAERMGIPYAFYVHTVLMGVCLLLVVRMPDVRATYEGAFGKNVGSLLRQRGFLVFLASSLVVGLGVAVRNNYFAMYVVELGGGESLIGWALAVGTLTELPIFFFSDRLLARFGPRRMLAFSFFVYGLRIFLCSQVQVPIWLVFLQLLNGPSFGIMWVSGVAYARECAPPGLGATAQSLFTSVFMGLASSVGAIIGGQLYDVIGPTRAFLLAGVGVGIGLLLFLVAVATERPVAELAVLT